MAHVTSFDSKACDTSVTSTICTTNEMKCGQHWWVIDWRISKNSHNIHVHRCYSWQFNVNTMQHVTTSWRLRHASLYKVE